MQNLTGKSLQKKKFYLDKWYLDFTGDDGSAMIFYAAKLTWNKLTVQYKSNITYTPELGTKISSGFRQVMMPILNNNHISWKDSSFKVSGDWALKGSPLEAQLYKSKEGGLHWKCHQPSSNVQLTIKDREIVGTGYAEQLILTVPPWKIPVNELRWGRFGSGNSSLVWIELKEKDEKKWCWYNGEKIENCSIDDNRILIPQKEVKITLDKGIVLESEKKISSVVSKIVKYLPGFNKIIPIGFLLADETKWLSKGRLYIDNCFKENGSSIHELVTFYP